MNGKLDQISFPKLLWSLYREAKSGALEVKKGQVSKKIFFKDGSPVHAESNLLHETLGKFLVEQKLITSDQEQAAVVKSLESQKPLHDSLIELGALDAAKVSEALKKNFALKILDCFSWDKGSYQFEENGQLLENILSLRMNPGRLILKGVDSTYPESNMERDGFSKEQSFKIVSAPGYDVKELHLGKEDIKLLKEMKNEVNMDTLTSKADLEAAALLRRVYAFWLLGLVTSRGEGAAKSSEKDEISLDELVGASLLANLQPAEPTVSVDEADEETKALANEIAENHLNLMNLNYFELLEAEETATNVQIRDKFMEFATKYSPNKFSKPAMAEFRSQGEEIFLKGVKAFSTLSDFDSKTKYLDKIKAERKKAQDGRKKKAGEAFKIQTSLLDATSQFQKGQKFLKEKNYDKAVEFFEYAIDIDSRKPSYVAHMGWAKYQQNPERNGKEAEDFLKRACDMTPIDAWASFYYGRFLIETERKKDGLKHLKTAAELEPKNIDIIRALRNAEK